MTCCNRCIIRMTGLHIISNFVQYKCKNTLYFNIIPMCRNFSNLTLAKQIIEKVFKS